MNRDMIAILANYERAKEKSEQSDYDTATDLLIRLIKFSNQEAELAEPALNIAGECINTWKKQNSLAFTC